MEQLTASSKISPLKQVAKHWKKLVNLGNMGKQKMKDVITEVEEELLWEKGVLGCSDAKTLNRTVFYILSQHFGPRGRQEHHDIRREELKVVKLPNGETMFNGQKD